MLNWVKYMVIWVAFSSSSFAQSNQRLEGEWMGIMGGEFGREIFILKLKKQNNEVKGTLYDSNYSDQSFCFSEVTAKIIGKDKFLVEGKKIIASRSIHTHFNNLSILYFDFQHPDTIVTKIVEEGNYAALLDKSSGKVFKMSRKPILASVTTTIASPPSATTKESHSPIQTLIIQDSDRDDGDVVSVTLNGKLLIDILVVTVKPYLIPIELNKGKNIVAVTSLSEGSISPTTVKMAILIDNYTQENETMIMNKGETAIYELSYR